jgi:Na+-translocating ferredoxin:NAD+ oxidoreductase subunit B
MFGRKNRIRAFFRKGRNHCSEIMCVCPSCGFIKQHEKGVACFSLLCPKCNSRMIRKDVLEKASDNQKQLIGRTLENKSLYPKVNPDVCIACGKCILACPFKAISIKNNVAYIDEGLCRKCRKCISECPVNAIQ